LCVSYSLKKCRHQKSRLPVRSLMKNLIGKQEQGDQINMPPPLAP
jgi:hypothetical protein